MIQCFLSQLATETTNTRGENAMVGTLFFHLSPKFDTCFEIIWFVALLGKPFFSLDAPLFLSFKS